MLSSLSVLRRTGCTPFLLACERAMSHSPLYVDLMARLRLPERLANGEQLRADLADPSSELFQTAHRLLDSAPAAEQERFLRELEESARAGVSDDAESLSQADALIGLRALLLPKVEQAAGQQPPGVGDDFEAVKREFVDRLAHSRRFEGPEGQFDVDDTDVKLLSEFFENMSPDDISSGQLLGKLFSVAARKTGASDDVLAQLDVAGIKRDDLARGAVDPQSLFRLVDLSQAQFNGEENKRTVFNDPASEQLLAGNYRQAVFLLSNSTPSTRGKILATYSPPGETRRAAVLVHDCAVHSLIDGWSDDELQAYLLLRMEHQDIAPDAETYRRVRETMHGRGEPVEIAVKAFLRWFNDSGATTASEADIGLDQDDYDEIKQRFALHADQDAAFTPDQFTQFAEEMAQRKLSKHFSQEQIAAAAQLDERQFQDRLLDRFARNPELVKELGLDGAQPSLAKIGALFADDATIAELLGKLDTIPARQVERVDEITQSTLRAQHATDALAEGITSAGEKTEQKKQR